MKIRNLLLQGAALAMLLCDLQAQAIRILPLGDSITSGNHLYNSYRRPLWHTLDDAGYSVDFIGSLTLNFDGPAPNPDFDLDHEGRWGWRADEILDDLPGWLGTYTPDVVLLHIGTNDAIQNSACPGGTYVECTVAEIEGIIDALRVDNPNVVILLATMIPAEKRKAPPDPNWGPRIIAVNQEIPGIAASKTTSQSPVILVDQFTGFNLATDTYDGVHPNETGAAKIAQKFYQALKAVLPGVVLGRHIFYNGSAWDGSNEAANAQDDQAIAPDKVALFPGQQASFDHYTSYSKGINGVMVDMVLKGTPTAADFSFKVGNNNDPSTWAAAPAPASVAVRPGAGVSGSDRVTIVWSSGSITKTWLQVRVLANARTGLTATDTFYFGNAIGEAGNSASDAKVTSHDAALVLTHMKAVATLTDPYDHDRSKRVNGADAILVLGNLAPLTSLELIVPNTGVLGPSSLKEEAVMSTSDRPVIIELERRHPDRVDLVVYCPPPAQFAVFGTTSFVQPAWKKLDTFDRVEVLDSIVKLKVNVDPHAAAQYFRIEQESLGSTR